jgi:hypothetical protein
MPRTEEVNTWSRWELPALRAIRDVFDEASYGSIIGTTVVLERLALDGSNEDAWGRAIDRLDRHGYIEASRAMWGRPYPRNIVRLTEKGLRASGVWPDEQAGLEALAAAFREGANKAEAEDPEAAGRLREVASWLLAGGREIAVGVGEAYLKHLSGLP